jgi:LysM domain
MRAAPAQLLKITPSSPNGAPGQYRPVLLGIAGDPPITMVSGSGGWQVVDRPKLIAATQWFDRSPYQIVITAYIDPSVTGANTLPDNDVAQIMSWMDAPSVTSSVIQPPTLTLSGPLTAANQFTWVLYDVEFDEAIRSFTTSTEIGAISGWLMSQKVVLTLYEYNPPFPSTDVKKSPAATATKASSSGATKTYVIKKGDTLAGIASQQMKGSSLSLVAREGAIVALNASDPTLNFRSPNQVLTVLVGKTIRIPSS